MSQKEKKERKFNFAAEDVADFEPEETVKNKENVAKSAGEAEVKPVRKPVQAFIIGIFAPAFIMWLAWAMYPLVYHKDILAGVNDFSDCIVVRFDSITGSMVPTNETIEIAQVDHEIKLV